MPFLIVLSVRPATLQLLSRPSSVHSTPDGACLFAIDEPADDNNTVSLSAYHWASLGSSEGIKIKIPRSAAAGCIITSFHSRNHVYLLGVDLAHGVVRSVAFTITRRVTEFTFKEKGGQAAGRNMQTTRHNSIVDCHAEVWKRFPVVPAVHRETLMMASRKPRALVFVSSIDHSPFKAHFSSLIEEFERTTRKPVGDELEKICVIATDHDSFSDEEPFERSRFRAGEWLVELLCLIPIHIAVTKDNRFVPLKDGVWSADVERMLLGADVAKIVDSITFGWYESLFTSYMAKKVCSTHICIASPLTDCAHQPVKVVSSMGEYSLAFNTPSPMINI